MKHGKKRFRLEVAARVLMVLIFLLLTWYLIYKTPFWLVSIWMLLFAGWSLFSLFRFVEHTYDDMEQLLLSLQQRDFTINFKPEKKSFPILYQQMKDILQQYQALAKSKITDYQFFEKVVEHTGIPILAYRDLDKTVKLVNPAFLSLFDFRQFIKLDQLENRYASFRSKIGELQSGDRVLIEVDTKDGETRLSVSKTTMQLEGESIAILAMQNISSELDQQEVEAWQKLIRVLTHEIKNSVIPISTLSEVIEDLLPVHEESISLTGEEAEDFRLSVKTINKRSKGLVKFVEKYSDLSRVPKPDFATVSVDILLENVVRLFESDGHGVLPTIQNSTEKTVFADEQMIEQVLINLIKNAKEALADAENPKITIFQQVEARFLKIAVTDNGPGMDKETQRNIFVPFFTTKESGSGIGLSLSRQILRAHQGSLHVSSQPGQGTTFELRLPLTSDLKKGD
jgi:signal transduction histidine kinase